MFPMPRGPRGHRTVPALIFHLCLVQLFGERLKSNTLRLCLLQQLLHGLGYVSSTKSRHSSQVVTFCIFQWGSAGSMLLPNQQKKIGTWSDQPWSPTVARVPPRQIACLPHPVSTVPGHSSTRSLRASRLVPLRISLAHRIKLDLGFGGLIGWADLSAQGTFGLAKVRPKVRRANESAEPISPPSR